MSLPADLQRLDDALEATGQDARAVVANLTDAAGAWRAVQGSWSVAECIDHLATADRVYLAALRPAAERAAAANRVRKGPAKPGLIGGWFVNQMEPQTTRRLKAPRAIRPRTAPPLRDAFAAFLASHAEVRAFLREYAAIDLVGVTFANPFITGLRFSLATGLHVIAAHERRHLSQAWGVRRLAEAATAPGPPRS